MTLFLDQLGFKLKTYQIEAYTLHPIYNLKIHAHFNRAEILLLTADVYEPTTVLLLFNCYHDTGYQDIGYHDTGYQGIGYHDTGYQYIGYQDIGPKDIGYQDIGYHDIGYHDMVLKTLVIKVVFFFGHFFFYIYNILPLIKKLDYTYTTSVLALNLESLLEKNL